LGMAGIRTQYQVIFQNLRFRIHETDEFSDRLSSI
jgi:hypothetical protein